MMRRKNNIVLTVLAVICLVSLSNCTSESESTKNAEPTISDNSENTRIPVVFDTDANNELDDQHALAYLLFNGNNFDVKGITVNATYNGGNIEEQYAEAERVMKLCNLDGKIPLIKGANTSFKEIMPTIDDAEYDGYKAVDFIIDQAKKHTKEKLVILAVGKLTNVALALAKDPSISKNIRLVWLGANYPEPGEYNLDNDIPSMNYLLAADIQFEMVTVRYGKPSGTDVVRVLEGEPQQTMPGLGPQIDELVTGRHGDTFSNFGDYSVSLFNHCEYHGDPPGRSLFDMAAVAIVKEPSWAEATVIPCPIMVDKVWVDQPDNKRKIIIWENFDKEAIMEDFYGSLNNYVLVK